MFDILKYIIWFIMTIGSSGIVSLLVYVWFTDEERNFGMFIYGIIGGIISFIISLFVMGGLFSILII